MIKAKDLVYEYIRRDEEGNVEEIQRALDQVNVTVEPGSFVAVLGHNGSGKSTFAKHLNALLSPTEGQIYIDGKDIRDVTQKSLRESIAYVPQESSLFHRSIFENIAYGKMDATREEVVRAAKLANADEFIRELPNGYDTLVGERGVKLSGGQRQRVAIARAILKDAPILVLDEATSALDNDTEAAIMESINRLHGRKTLVIIAHRLQTIEKCDLVYRVENGKATVERGRI